MFVEQDLWYVCGLGLVVCLWTKIGGMFMDYGIGGMFVD